MRSRQSSGANNEGGGALPDRGEAGKAANMAGISSEIAQIIALRLSKIGRLQRGPVQVGNVV